MLQRCIHQLVVWFCASCVNDWLLSFFLVPSWSFNMPPYPQSAVSQGACPQLLILSLFSLQFHIWVYQEAWERVKEEELISWVTILIILLFCLGCFWCCKSMCKKHWRSS
jgi:hypothetical protein